MLHGGMEYVTIVKIVNVIPLRNENNKIPVTINSQTYMHVSNWIRWDGEYDDAILHLVSIHSDNQFNHHLACNHFYLFISTLYKIISLQVSDVNKILK
jgi:hypothetical protein